MSIKDAVVVRLDAFRRGTGIYAPKPSKRSTAIQLRNAQAHAESLERRLAEAKAAAAELREASKQSRDVTSLKRRLRYAVSRGRSARAELASAKAELAALQAKLAEVELHRLTIEQMGDVDDGDRARLGLHFAAKNLWEVLHG